MIKKALNVLAYGDVVEECIGHQRTIKGTKIVITADDLLVIKGQNILIASTRRNSTCRICNDQSFGNDKELS